MSGERPSWHGLKFDVSKVDADLVTGRCFELGSCGLEVEERGETVGLVAYFPHSSDSNYLRAEIAAAMASAVDVEDIAVTHIVEEDWEVEWRRFYVPVWATREIVIHPPWLPVVIEPGQIAVVIEPKMAFGTGGHQSTRLCLAALQAHLQPGARCLDLGCGSGVLSIAAVKLGASVVEALDVDAQAIANAQENVDRNGIRIGVIRLAHGSIELAGGRSFDLIMANIQSHVLVPLIPQLAALMRQSGRVVFGGLLEREREDFCCHLNRAGMAQLEISVQDDWIAVVAEKSA